jgi:hypothetical protein
MASHCAIAASHLARLASLAIGLASAAPLAAGQEAAREPTIDTRRVARGPVVDGRLDDPAWAGAAIVSDFRQKEPVEGQEATETTRVRIVYDQATLYVGVELLDGAPAEIRASELRRDNSLESDDTFAVLIDSNHDHRNAFVFRVNPRGTRYDGIIRNEGRNINSDWDEQWTAAATLTERGWVAEIAIPFKILRFSGAKDQRWGVNFERVIKRKNESAYWAGWDRSYAFYHVSQAGHLAGLSEIRQVERMRLRPYVVAGAEKLDAVAGPLGRRAVRAVGIDDLKLAATSSLTADLSVNPDFAQTEVDQQRVNLTRFSLFFPEKRQFFIEGSDSLRMGVGLLHFGPPPLELMYSRRIGLSDRGEPTSIIGGGKLTGKAGGLDLGVLNVQTEREGSQPGENFGVVRLRKEVLGRSYVGALVTNREGGGRFNRVAGADARFVFRQHLTVAGLAARSFATSAGGSQWARQLGAEWVDDTLEAGANYIEIDPAFEPGIGFLRRHDRLVGARGSVKPRPRGTLVRQFEITPSAVVYHDRDGTLVQRDATFTFGTAFQSGDRIDVAAGSYLERLRQPFPIGAGVVVPVGLYEWNNARVTLRSFNGRKVGANATMDIGDFYRGTKRSVDLGGEVRPNKNISLNASYGFNKVDLPEGAFRTHLAGLRVNVSFTTTLLTSAYLQYNSSGDLAAVHVRLNYIFRTIDNVYLVYNDTRFTAGQFVDKHNRSLVLKVTYSVHR